MGRFPKMPFIQVLGILLILMCSVTFSMGTAVSMEDRLTNLETKYFQMEEKNNRLEEKVTELEAKNVHLETKVKEQEKILISLLIQTNQSESGSKSIFGNHQTAIRSTGKMNGTARTCEELRAADPSLPSGMYSIDPDGQNYGHAPLPVYCNMTSGSTLILHDSESPMNVSHCIDPGCYRRPIYYNGVPFKQIEYLIELSAECHQSIKYDCYNAPFEFENTQYAWWNDIDGNAQYFWAGNNTEGIHTCQCGIDGNCFDNSLKCNCDAAAPIQLSDDGVITDKNVLPVTQLNFGWTPQSSFGVHTLGRLECTGSSAPTELPKSCEDLLLNGHTLNGIYSVMGTKMMESVYCNFTKLPDDAGFQKWIGYVDVKSTPVYFYVQRNSSFNKTGTPISFELEVVNEGNAMNLTSGKFTAPRTGTYFFSFTGVAKFPRSSPVAARFGVFLSGDRYNSIGRAGVDDEANTIADKFSPFTMQSTLYMKKDDQVYLGIDLMSPGASLFDYSVGYLTHFTGFMLNEQLVG